MHRHWVLYRSLGSRLHTHVTVWELLYIIILTNFIFVKYNTNHNNHSKTFEMVNNQDKPMDPDPNIPPGQKPPDRSPATRERSASPWACANRPSRRRDPRRWTYNHMLGILQHASDCTICGAYVTHFMESHLMENASFMMRFTAETLNLSRS